MIRFEFSFRYSCSRVHCACHASFDDLVEEQSAAVG